MPPPRLVTDGQLLPVRYPKGQESTLDTEIELRNVIEQQNLTPVTHVDTQNITLAENENLTHITRRKQPMSDRCASWETMTIGLVRYLID